MKRALVIAAIALGVGCTSSPPPPAYANLTLYWHFVGAQGQQYGNGTNANTGCAQAGVDSVQVTLTGPYGYTSTDDSPCVTSSGAPGITYPGVYAGPFTWTIVGRRNGLPVYSVTETNVNVAGDAVFDVAPAALYPDLNVTYTLPTGDTCNSPTAVQQMSFALFQGGSLYLTNSGTSFFPLVCGDPPSSNVFTVPSLPQGGYTFRYVAALNNVGTSLYQQCGLNVPQGSTNPQSVLATLAVATSSCP